MNTTKNLVVDIQDAARGAESLYSAAVQNNEVQIELETGERGGIRLDSNGNYEHWAADKNGNSVSPAILERKSGGAFLVWSWLRDKKVGAIQPTSFGPLPTPQTDNFFITRAEDQRSIIRRPFLGIRGPSNLSFAFTPNGFPWAVRQFLMLYAEFKDGESVNYPFMPQILDPKLITQVLAVASALGQGWLLGFNAVHAGASCNMHHWHGFGGGERFPVEAALKVHVRDNLAYVFGAPAGCVVIENGDPVTLWHFVDRCQRMSIPYNIAIRGGDPVTIYFFARRAEHELSEEFPTGVLAVSECMELFVVSKKPVYHALRKQILDAGLRKTTRSATEILQLMK